MTPPQTPLCPFSSGASGSHSVCPRHRPAALWGRSEYLRQLARRSRWQRARRIVPGKPGRRAVPADKRDFAGSVPPDDAIDDGIGIEPGVHALRRKISASATSSLPSGPNRCSGSRPAAGPLRAHRLESRDRLAADVDLPGFPGSFTFAPESRSDSDIAMISIPNNG